MPRNPDLPCAVCGKLMWRRKGSSLPLGQSTCKPCRSSTGLGRTPVQWASCEQCGELFEAKWSSSSNRLVRTCSRSCGQQLRFVYPAYQRVCTVCSSLFEANNARASVCSTKCRNKIKNAGGQRQHKGRARSAGVPYEPVDRRRVFVRDGWCCGVCGGAVDPELTHPDPLSASLDHIVPISLGGPHLYSNVQCAHLKCNIDKGATLPEGATLPTMVDDLEDDRL